MRPEMGDGNKLKERTPPARIELATPGLGTCDHNDVNDNADNELRKDGNAQVPSMVPSPSNSESKVIADPTLEPDLFKIVAAWPDLPKAIQAGILAMVNSWLNANR